MTKQEYYDRLYAAAYDNTFPSIDGSGCRYRMGGKACAVGVFLPPDLDTEPFEGVSLHADWVWKKFSPYAPEGMSFDDVVSTQDVHDSQASRETWHPEQFIKTINGLPCFADVVRREPKETNP